MKQGIDFDRFELDVWVDEYISAHGRQASSNGVNSWQERKHQSKPYSLSYAEREELFNSLQNHRLIFQVRVNRFLMAGILIKVCFNQLPCD